MSDDGYTQSVTRGQAVDTLSLVCNRCGWTERAMLTGPGVHLAGLHLCRDESGAPVLRWRGGSQSVER